MVSIIVSKDKFDNIVKREKSTVVGKDLLHIKYLAKSTSSFNVLVSINGVPLKESNANSNEFKISIESKFGENYVDIIFLHTGDQTPVQQKSLVIDFITINGINVEKSNFGMDKLYCGEIEQEQYKHQLARSHGGYFGFFGRVRIPYYRFKDVDDNRIHKRNDYGVDVNNKFTKIFDQKPRKTKDLLQNG
jgi:hypothetical protein